MPANNHTLLIKHNGKIEFKAIFTNDGYFRVQIDDLDYEPMMDELWEKGYETFEKIATEQTPEGCTRDIFDVTRTQNFSKNIQNIYQFLIDSGFECELIAESNIPSLTVTAYGKDLHPDVIANSEDGLFSDFTISLYKQVNNVYYEPKLEKEASSFKVMVKEIDIDTFNLSNLLQDFKNKVFDTEKYFTNEQYKKLVNSFINLKYIKTLKHILINEDENLKFTKNDIVEFEEMKDQKISERPFSANVEKESLRAFDNKNCTFKYDSGQGVLHMHAEQALYDRIKRATSLSIQLNGTYTKIKSVKVTSIITPNN